MLTNVRPGFAVAVAVLTVWAAGCSSAVPPAATPAPTARAAAALPAAPVLHGGRKEATLVAGPRRRLEETFAALQKGDIAAARAALEAYDGEWNGIEVYVNVRSRELYGEIETHYQADITTALSAPQPDAGQIIPLLQSMVGRYDEAIALCDSGAPLSPIFDDVAAVRIVRAPLRTVSPALKAGDTGKASTSWHAFKDHWREAAPLFAARSSEAKQETDAALAAVDTAMSAPTIDPALAGPLVDALLERYNYGVNLLNAAARNADLSKNTFTAEDVRAAAALGALQKDLRDSLSNWQSGVRSAAADSARTAANAHFESASGALRARGGADAAVKKALDAYTVLAGQASDGAQIGAANKVAIEAVAIGQQVLVGQFWTDPAFATAYQSAVRNT